MSSLSDALDGVAAGLVRERRGRLAVHSRAQAATFPFAERLSVIGNGLDLDRYTFSPAPGGAGGPAPLGWVGRVAAEKGLEDALAAAERADLPLHVWGVVEDAGYWASLADRYPATLVARGFLPTDQLQAELGRCRALLMTPKWVEAYGNVVAEAMACGVPVVTYRRGGPAELVEDGVSGFVVPPDSVAALAEAIGRVGELDRASVPAAGRGGVLARRLRDPPGGVARPAAAPLSGQHGSPGSLARLRRVGSGRRSAQEDLVVGGATVPAGAPVVVVASVPQTGLSVDVTTSNGVAASTRGGGVVGSGPATMARPFS